MKNYENALLFFTALFAFGLGIKKGKVTSAIYFKNVSLKKTEQIFEIFDETFNLK